ncbi:MFS transporter [Pandoraea sp. XJJ-1]|uniref:Proline/betaine transporter n=1 Tax=Pandoraea cepalis TaxID=2508294 RepID=A0A5E4R9V9_9BURK|nr:MULTISPECIES: MFS transporter [Pandoraea]MBN9116809.1 MFS transporter [Pandoraea sp.]OJY21193.1 MAG: MFS transporter [Pandoraea sp. 64-18]WAL83017.1 MFS transporter [Pandoraea sp. XJJ-1]VVD60156.1 Proline/betaine transporter [Pandoraea cepalis]BDD91812.1 MFS transporter [Pandoraea sp. NE5]
MSIATSTLTLDGAQPSPMTAAQQRKIVFAAVIGNLLEFFDFTVYSYFALTIGKQFFPAHDPVTSSLLAFAVFAVGFVMRPLGGFVLGRYADRAGRKPALTLTIGLMALGSAAIGLAPTYAQIGLAAPLLIVAARLLQGFAQGGEFGAATATLLEMGGAKRRGFRASWQLASQGAAALLGSGLAASLGFLLSDDIMHSWGWRIPFLLGTLIAPVGIYLRRHIQEEPPKAKTIAGRDDPKRGVYVRNWFLTIFSIMGMSVSTYVMMYYMPTYCIQYLGLPPKMSMLTGVAASTISLVMCPIYGALSDKMGRRKPLTIIGRVALVVLLYPAFWIMTHFPSLPVVLAALIVLMLCYTMGSAPAYALMPENFPKHLRAGYMSSAYAIAVSVFGGTAQLVAGWLIRATGNKMAPAWYMIVCVIISLIAVSMFEETGNKVLDE